MIQKNHLREAFAESVGVNPFDLGVGQNNGTFFFVGGPLRQTLTVVVKDGRITNEPFLGMTLTKAVLRHMKTYEGSSVIYTRLEDK
jgi:hypothetical protein